MSDLTFSNLGRPVIPDDLTSPQAPQTRFTLDSQAVEGTSVREKYALADLQNEDIRAQMITDAIDEVLAGELDASGVTGEDRTILLKYMEDDPAMRELAIDYLENVLE